MASDAAGNDERKSAGNTRAYRICKVLQTFRKALPSR
jgi:hypothetical protein